MQRMMRMSERMRWKCHQQIDGKCVMNETTWFEWGHCVVICTTNAITNIDNTNETQSEQCQTVDDAIKSQRSLRSIKREVDPNETNKDIVNVTTETPTTRNYRNVKYAIINQHWQKSFQSVGKHHYHCQKFQSSSKKIVKHKKQRMMYEEMHHIW